MLHETRQKTKTRAREKKTTKNETQSKNGRIYVLLTRNERINIIIKELFGLFGELVQQIMSEYVAYTIWCEGHWK